MLLNLLSVCRLLCQCLYFTHAFIHPLFFESNRSRWEIQNLLLVERIYTPILLGYGSFPGPDPIGTCLENLQKGKHPSGKHLKLLWLQRKHSSTLNPCGLGVSHPISTATAKCSHSSQDEANLIVCIQDCLLLVINHIL